MSKSSRKRAERRARDRAPVSSSSDSESSSSERSSSDSSRSPSPKEKRKHKRKTRSRSPSVSPPPPAPRKKGVKTLPKNVMKPSYSTPKPKRKKRPSDPTRVVACKELVFRRIPVIPTETPGGKKFEDLMEHPVTGKIVSKEKRRLGLKYAKDHKIAAEDPEHPNHESSKRFINHQLKKKEKKPKTRRVKVYSKDIGKLLSTPFEQTLKDVERELEQSMQAMKEKNKEEALPNTPVEAPTIVIEEL